MLTVKRYLEKNGKRYPEPDREDGSISLAAFDKAGLPMVVACTNCTMTMVCGPDRACDEDGKIFCDDCAAELKVNQVRSKLEYPPPRRIWNLGALLNLAARSFAREEECHLDVEMMYGPSECHVVVSQGAQRIYLELARMIENQTGLTPKDIIEEMKQRLGGKIPYRLYYGALHGIYAVEAAVEDAKEREEQKRLNRRLAAKREKRLP